MAQQVPVDITAANISSVLFSQYLTLLVGERSTEGREFRVAQIDEDDVFGGSWEFLATENAVRERQSRSFVEQTWNRDVCNFAGV